MTTEEAPVPPVSPSIANGETTSDDVVEPTSKREFSEGPCAHQNKKKLVENKKVRSALSKEKGSRKVVCVECARIGANSNSTPVVESPPSSMCLTCGHRLCEPHAIAHSKAPRSGDDHCLYYDDDVNSVRCFACEVVVIVEEAQHVKMLLNELKSFLKIKEGKGKEVKEGDKSDDKPIVLDKPEPKTEKKSQMAPSSQNGTSSAEEGGSGSNGIKKSRSSQEGLVSPKRRPENGYANGSGERPKYELALGSTAIPAKGLANLGNTCFFNSVMQCMLHTHQLAFYLERFGRVSRLNFLRPPKPIVVNDEKVEIEEATLAIRDMTTPLNDALKSFVVEFRSGLSPSPSRLFTQISAKAARFRSMAQQDAHELLRYLLDGLCSEETARYQEAIANLVGAPLKSSTKADPETMRMAKAYLQQAGRPLLDAVFGGRLLQTIRCSKCHHVSERYENMYDLSVPLTGSSSSGRTAPTRRDTSNRTMSSSSETLPNGTGGNGGGGGGARPSKHQQKKEAKEARKEKKKSSRSLKSAQSKTGEDEATIENKVEELRLNGDASEEEEEEGGKEEVKEQQPESSGGEEQEEGASYRPAEKTIDPLDLTKVLTTMRTSLPSGQSIAASLLEFTAEERLEGTNAYECEKCCTPLNKKKGATGAAKTRVEATKRYLIVTPPVVLTIHVKRFMQTHVGMKVSTRKVGGHVHFPLVFDIAPFCCKNVERISPGQTSILYSLYGVVSHSGNLSGGHYVAYVKSRERIPQTESMLEAARAVCADVQAEPARAPSPASAPPAHERPDDAARDVPKGQWYYCSDLRVSAISESKVLNEEAYLLFYERIY